MKKTCLILALLTFAAGCGEEPAPQAGASPKASTVILTARQLAESLQRQQDLQLVDVRTPKEWNSGFIRGARHIPLNELEARLEELNKDKPAILYCKKSGRSAKAAKLLAKKGFGRIGYLRGGILAWRAAGYPISR